MSEKSKISILRVAIANIIAEDAELTLLLEKLVAEVKGQEENSPIYHRSRNKTVEEIIKSEFWYHSFQYVLDKGYLEAIKDLIRPHQRANLSLGEFIEMKQIVDEYKAKNK